MNLPLGCVLHSFPCQIDVCLELRASPLHWEVYLSSSSQISKYPQQLTTSQRAHGGSPPGAGLVDSSLIPPISSHNIIKYRSWA